MKKFTLSGIVGVSVYTVVEAETLEEAIKISEDRDVVKYQWGDENLKNESWVNDEYDGEVRNIKEH
jgi:hypothetical protein